jgi:Helix-turn-helix domain
VSEDLRALLAVGTRLAYDGLWWQVSELDGPHVLLTSPAGVRRVSAGHLLADPSTRLHGAAAGLVEGAGAELAGLGEAELAEPRARVAHVQEVRTGFRRGCAELAADGEPRLEYAAGVPLLARYAAKAAEAGVGVSTLRRWVKDFEEHGPAGLADDRWGRRRAPLARADPRWLEMARRVLAEHTEASKPTRDLILAEVAARVAAEHGDEAVPVPKLTRARALLREISKGTSAFGGTKAKREVAGRPAAPTVGCGRCGRVSTCCWIPPGWTCSRWTR